MSGPAAEAKVGPDAESVPLVEEWKPTFRVSMLLNLLGLILVVAGFLFFGVIAALASGGNVQLAGLDSLLTIAMLAVGTLVAHELVHGTAMLAYGARPRFGVALIQKIMPVAYCTSPGHWFSRGQFLVVALAPAIGLSALGILLMPFGNFAAWLIVPLAINLGGAVGDFWMAGILLRRNPDIQVEDLKDGLRIHHPAGGDLS